MRAIARSLSFSIFVLSAPCYAVDELPPDLTGNPVPQVLTPARLKQAQVDVAASVTVIDREMIESLGARDIPDLLRLVPGMMVTRGRSGEFAVNYHGTNLQNIDRLQVLVDGMSVYQPGQARVLWIDLALSIDDIARIEITRGPDAAAYGANAFSAIINIITTHPQDSADNMLRVAGGNRQTIDSGGRLVGHEEGRDWRASFWTREDSGFDFMKDGSEYRDDRRGGGVNWRSESRLTDNDRLEWFAGVKDGYNEELRDSYGGTLDSFEALPLNTVQNMHLMARWDSEISPDHSRRLQAYVQRTTIDNRFRACLNPIMLSDDLRALYALNPDGAGELLETAAGGGDVGAFIADLPTPEQQQLAGNVVTTFVGFAGAGYDQTCGDVAFDIDEGRFDIELQDTLRISDSLRAVAGAAYRRDRGFSATYTGVHRHNEVWRLFGHGEYRIAEPLTLNLGAMLESDDISGTNLSPRAGLNWRVGQQQSFRLVSSRAVRSQDIYEEFADISVTFRNLQPAWPLNGDTARDFFVTQHSPGTLVPEEITSHELGYFGYFSALRSSVDVRLFRERLSKLSSEPANIVEFRPTNASFTTLQGIEAQFKYSIAPGSWAWATYAYIDNDSSRPVEAKFTALHSGSIAIAQRFSSHWTGSAAVYTQQEQNFKPGSHNDRLDLMLARDIPLGGATLQVSGNAQCRFDDEPHIFSENYYDERIYGYLGLRLTY